MTVVVAPVCEILGARWTLEGSLPRVEPHVVDEVEVLSERLAAMITDMFRLGEVVCRVPPHFWSRH